jgi:hypothetical protein
MISLLASTCVETVRVYSKKSRLFITLYKVCRISLPFPIEFMLNTAADMKNV